MIEQLTLNQVPQSNMPWLVDVTYFKKNPTTSFKPGLNILFGENGSGKSSLVSMLAQSLAAAQGGTSVVTQTWAQDVFEFGTQRLKLPCEVVHDGQPVMYFDARAKEGLIAGSFDDEFFSLGLANTMARGSTGQLGFRRLERLLKVLLDAKKAEASAAPPKAEGGPPAPASTSGSKKGSKRNAASKKDGGVPVLTEVDGFPTEIEWRIKRNSVNDYWKEQVAQIEALLEPKCASGPKTLLFDEPESGFALPWQSGLWSNVFSKVDPAKFQVIVATHSPFALGIPGAHYIEMSPGYLRQATACVAALTNRL